MLCWQGVSAEYGPRSCPVSRLYRHTTHPDSTPTFPPRAASTARYVVLSPHPAGTIAGSHVGGSSMSGSVPEHDSTRLIQEAASSPKAAAELLALVYDQLRKIAQQRMNEERSDHTLQATALVHEAYLRLVGSAPTTWQGQGHFFAAAAEAMRRILIDHARRKNRPKHGGDCSRIDLGAADQESAERFEHILDLDEALGRLQTRDQVAFELVKLRYFAGLTMPQAAEALGIPLRNAERCWTYARAWLHRELSSGEPSGADTDGGP